MSIELSCKGNCSHQHDCASRFAHMHQDCTISIKTNSAPQNPEMVNLEVDRSTVTAKVDGIVIAKISKGNIEKYNN